MSPPVVDLLKLHCAYRDRKIFVWGEVEPRKASGRRLEFSARPARIARAIREVTEEKLPAAYQSAMIWLPTRNGKAIGQSDNASRGATTETTAAATIQPWTVSTAMLDAESAFFFLDACNRNPWVESFGLKVAPSTRFWGAALRFVADLASRDRFLPSVSDEGGSFHARWKPVIAAPDAHRLRQLAQAMPPAGHAITGDVRTQPEDDPAILLSGFVAWMMDMLPRIANRSGRRLQAGPHAANALHIDTVWMNRLQSIESEMPGNREVLSGFAERVEAWQRPVLREAAFPWLLRFHLHEPGPGVENSDSEDSAWRVEYVLEPVHGGPTPEPEKVPRKLLNRLLARAATICADIREDSDTFPLDVTGAFRFLTETAGALEAQGFQVALPEWWKRRQTSGKVRARAVVRPSPAGGAGMFSLGELMQFDWEVAIGGENYTREELDRLMASTAPLVKVHGQWVPFDPHSLRAALDLWKREPAPARDVIRMALGVADSAPGVEFEEARGEGWIGELLEKLGGRARFEELPAPSGFRGTLRPYQLRGFSWLGFLRQYGLGACLADDMGLGKTVQALALLQRDRESGVNRPTLLICPTSVVGNWRKEAARFAPDLPVLVHHGLSRTRGQDFVEEAARHALVVSSYALAHRDLDLLKEVAWSGIILDEAQNIKNPETRQSRAARSLTADYRIALTGTPVENSVGELWSIMEFLNPGFLGSAAEFKRRFVHPIQKRADSDAVDKLRKLTAPFILRRLKTDGSIVQDLPEKMEMKVFCNLTPEQASLYRSVVEDAGRALDGSTGIKRKGIVLATLTKLKQVCNHPAQFLGDESPLPGRSGKLSRLTEMVEELLSEGDRALIFSQFAEMGERLQRHLSGTFGREAMFLHGGVPAHKRDRMVERFQNGGDNGPSLFVLSLKAGGTGLNLTAANHVFHFDRWWNPAVEDQATDRAFRIGQKRNVQIHKFVCTGTLEEKIDEMIDRKKMTAGQVIGTGEAWLTELSTAEIKDLFALRKEALQ